MARVLANARRLNRGLHELGFDVVEPSPVTTTPPAPQRAIITPIVPVRVGEDWKAGMLWRALWDAGVFTNVAVHPAVPPDGALLRTSVMATHDDEVLDRALDALRDRQARVRSASTGRCPGPSRRRLCSAAQVRSRAKNLALSERAPVRSLTKRRSAAYLPERARRGGAGGTRGVLRSRPETTARSAGHRYAAERASAFGAYSVNHSTQ